MGGGSVRNIQTIRPLVHSQIAVPAPHSVTRCMLVSLSPHVLQRAESPSQTVCNCSLVGRLSWIITYQVAIVKSDDHVACRFYHTLTHSVVGWSCVIHLYRGLLPALDIEHKVSYTLCLNALGVSLCLGEVGGVHFKGIYPQVSQSLRYPPDMGVFPFTFAASSTVAILQMPIPHVGPGSTSGLAGALEIFPPQLSDPIPVLLPSLQGGDVYPEDDTLPYIPCQCRHYLTYALSWGWENLGRVPEFC